MKHRLPTRRQLLRGAGGFTLALPMLPSLFSSEARAKGGGLVPPRLVSIGTEHGGIWSERMHPAPATLTETMNYAGHQIRRGDLASTAANGRRSISDVLTGASDKLTAELVAKMNVIRGLDVPFYINHNAGGYLGNFAANDTDGGGGGGVSGLATPTIDQLLAWSGSFYEDLSGTLERTMVVGESHAFGWTSQQAQNEVTALPSEYSSLALFNRIFVPEDEEESPRPPVVDRVLENYQSLRNGNRRLSADDRRRLDEHIERIDELQRRLLVAVSCGDIPVPQTDAASIQQDPSYYVRPDLNAEYWSLFNDVIVAAFRCGTSRIATMGITDIFSNYSGDWHQDVAHQAHLPDGDRQGVLAGSFQDVFESVVLDLISKLDVDEGDGTTMLDNTLVQWAQESGPLTHESIDSCIVTAGGAGGCLRTGQYLDYRNTNVLGIEEHYQETPVRAYVGLLQQQYFASVLQTMGLAPGEYEIEPGGGYPRLSMADERSHLYPESVRSVRGEMLPWLEA